MTVRPAGDARSSSHASFDDAALFGESITRVYRPVFHDDDGRRANVEVVDRPGGRGFHAALSAHERDGVVLSTVNVTGHEVDYRGTVAPDDSALKIYYVSSGTAVIRQEGREQTVEAGQLGVHDSMQPYQIWTETGFDSLIMVVPKSRLLTLGAGYADLSAARFTAGEGAGRVVLPYLQGLAGGLDEVIRGQGQQLVRSTVDLLTMLFASAVGSAPDSPELRRRRRREDVEAWIREHLLDADLSPGRIASAHFMSTRALHALFAEVDTTVGTVVRRLRLDRARELLILHPTWALAEVGRWSGFSDPSYFSRAFRREFGMSPGEFRAAGA
ncbi:AraC family transcriptional regulator [Corynebacterium humireducens NBRC 106098 = DSM 45392]|uniref:AraC family transcriptional regulator n=1 Tax=Corynebacterium humireducens NBRC 106098 = DSM 45392 TaxID=1223515 RepID=A0A0B5DDT2_9CORY|nr:helix-turn-helix domain-containing protein [Corynebacterium humireducens]AJE33879.1 AraC family transcriptional regulator [Corynebacterium humireducens NBRC 106098 = DSM 45392]